MNEVEATNASATILERVLGTHCAVTDPNFEIANLEQWDSLKHMRLVLEIETELGVMLEAEEIEVLVTIGDIDRLFSMKAAA